MIAISLAVSGTLQTCDICNYMRIVAITFVVFRSLMSDELVLILVIGLQSQVDNLQDQLEATQRGIIKALKEEVAAVRRRLQ